jgi:YqaJ-like viral recombinase domain
MPVFYKVEPRSAAWAYLRLGRPTSSDFSRILTAGGKPSTQAEAYGHRLIAERWMGHPLNLNEPSYQGAWMVRGQELEDEAIQAYEFETDCLTSLGGFLTDDAGRYGCSPDRLCGDDGILEMKCPSAPVQVSYLDDSSSFAKEFFVQNQGQLLVSGRKWVDLVSYHPELPTLIKRVHRDEKYIQLMEGALSVFCRQLDMIQENLERMYGPFKPIVIPEEHPEPAEEIPAGEGLDISEDDIQDMITAGIIRPGE